MRQEEDESCSGQDKRQENCPLPISALLAYEN